MSSDLSLFDVVLCQRRAKLLLKKKRFAESMIEKTEAQLDNLEQMVRWIRIVYEDGRLSESAVIVLGALVGVCSN